VEAVEVVEDEEVVEAVEAVDPHERPSNQPLTKVTPQKL